MGYFNGAAAPGTELMELDWDNLSETEVKNEENVQKVKCLRISDVTASVVSGLRRDPLFSIT